MFRKIFKCLPVRRSRFWNADPVERLLDGNYGRRWIPNRSAAWSASRICPIKATHAMGEDKSVDRAWTRGRDTAERRIADIRAEHAYQIDPSLPVADACSASRRETVIEGLFGRFGCDSRGNQNADSKWSAIFGGRCSKDR